MSGTRYRSRLLQYRSPNYRYRGSTFVPAEDTLGADVEGYAVYIIAYTSGGEKVAEFAADADDSRAARCNFDLLETGPGHLTVDFRNLPTGITLTHDMRLDVHLWGRSRPIYSGYITKVPAPGTTDWPATYEAFGFVKQLDDLLVTGTYTSQTIHRIVDTLARDIEGRTRIVYNRSKVIRNALSKYPLQEIRFNKTPMKRALEQLAGLAGGFVFGVDADRQFFFRPPDTSIANDSIFSVPEDIAKFEPVEDSGDVKNVVYIQYGQVDGGGDNYLSDPLRDATSEAAYRTRETTVRAPNVYSEADAYRWGAVQLSRSKDPVTRTTIAGLTLLSNSRDITIRRVIDCVGYVRVTDTDGTDHELPKKKVAYTADGSGLKVDIQLGELKRDMAQLAAELQQRQQVTELMQNLINQQL